MRIALVQPPFTQLNSPYPAVFYLKSFLKGLGYEASCADLGIEAARAIFSAEGARLVFEDAEAALPEILGRSDDAAAEVVMGFLSEARLYEEALGRAAAFMAGEDDSFGTRISRRAGIPTGPRLKALRASGEGVDALSCATKLLEDFADFIAHCLDPSFSLVRYADRKASSGDFRPVEDAALEGYVMNRFLAPLAARRLPELLGEPNEAGPKLLCLSVPFPGCLAPALRIAREARSLYGDSLVIAMGGGYASTELRYLKDAGIFDYADVLAFDKGYAALSGLIGRMEGSATKGSALFEGLHRVAWREGGGIRYSGFEEAEIAAHRAEGIDSVASKDPASEAALERLAVEGCHPDYSEARLGLYLRVRDSGNPMHSLWSEGKWLKCYLAHGCYHAKCSFCDVSLDYVKDYRPLDPEALFRSMRAQCERSGSRGIHFADEALPPARLLHFALLNIAEGRPLEFWGNIRFERAFDPGVCGILAEAGFLGASGGIEDARAEGLLSVGKGIDLEALVASLAAFAGAGIPVHAYMIYGLPGQDERALADSLELLRQLFELGLVTSSFWHRFTLTRHSRYMAMRAAGQAGAPEPLGPSKDFASNDLSWKGEGLLDRWGPGLDAALADWMGGRGVERPISRYFGFKIPASSVEPGAARALMEKARARWALEAEGKARVAWLGGIPLASGKELAWSYRGSLKRLELDSDKAADRLAEALEEARPRPGSLFLARAEFEAMAGLAVGGGAARRLQRAGLQAF